VLRIVLGERQPLRAWRPIRRPLSSQLIRVECLRTIDRARVRLSLDESVVARRRAAVLEVLDGFDTLPLDAVVLARAAEPFPTTVGTLDAIHLASALRVRSEISDLKLATHDSELATAALAVGFDVLGAPSSAD